MTRQQLTLWSLRGLAVGIALAAAIDPAITSARMTRPKISVIAVAPSADSALAARIAHTLGGAFAVIPAPFAAADATVLIGDHLPSATDALATPVFAVLPDRSGPTVTIESVRAPARAPLDARVPIVATVRVTAARGRTVELALRAGGVVVDRATRLIATADERIALPLSFAPTAAGAAPLRVTADLAGSSLPRTTAAADVVVDVRDKRWAVLFFDPRPSWMATFVERAIEQDNRFVVTSRVVTSRNISTDVGQPPGRLDDLATLGLYDAVIVGAPEALSQADIAGLDAFLRRRGGSVVMLFDQHATGPYQSLTATNEWTEDSSGATVTITPVTADSGGLRASDVAWPAHLPAGAQAVALTAPRKGDSTRHPVIWRSAVGAGELVVSGALDAWRFRDPSVSAFDHVWQTIIADAANAAPPPVAVTISNAMLAPGESATLTVTLRDEALQSPAADAPTARSIRGSVSATIESMAQAQGPPTVVRLWPDGAIGQFTGELEAPAAPGSYRVVVTGDGQRVETPLVVAVGASHPAPGAEDLLAAWVGARGGRVVPADQIPRLGAALRGAIRPAPHPVRWYPMRSLWWLFPFVLALSGEWWLRRRRGLA